MRVCFIFAAAALFGSIVSNGVIAEIGGDNSQMSLRHRLADLNENPKETIQQILRQEALSKGLVKREDIEQLLITLEVSFLLEESALSGLILEKAKNNIDSSFFPELGTKLKLYDIELSLQKNDQLGVLSQMHSISSEAPSLKKSLNAKLFYLRGILYHNMMRYDQSKNVFEQSIKLLTPDDLLLAFKLHLEFANLLMMMEQEKSALEKNSTVIDIAQELNSKIMLIRALLQRGVILHQWQDYPASSEHLKEAVRLLDDSQWNDFSFQVVFLLIDNLLQLESFNEAKTFLELALDNAMSLQDDFWTAKAKFVEGKIYTQQSQNDLAILGLIEALQLSEKLMHHKLRIDVLGQLAKVHERKGEFQKANDYMKQLNQLTKTMTESIQQQQYEQIQVFDQYLNVEKRIELLNQQNILQSVNSKVKAIENQTAVFISVLIILFLGSGFYGISLIRQKNRQMNKLTVQLKDMVVRDPLTMLYNRRYLQETAEQLMANNRRRFERSQGKDGCMGFILLDIDHFRRINDYYGHEVGDYILKRIAEDLKHDCREGDVVIRWGGEEFLILVNDTNFPRIESFCRRLINDRNQKYINYQQMKHQVTCSIGFILYPFSEEFINMLDWEQTVKVVTTCLTKAKREGRNRGYGIEYANMPESEKLLLLTDLEACVDQGWVKLSLIEGVVSLDQME